MGFVYKYGSNIKSPVVSHKSHGKISYEGYQIQAGTMATSPSRPQQFLLGFCVPSSVIKHGFFS
jgi:hypothetical protein